jgi:hypothetical protein
MTRHEFLAKLTGCRACRRDRLAVAVLGAAAGLVLLVAVRR